MSTTHAHMEMYYCMEVLFLFKENVWVLQEDGILKSSIQELYKGTLPPSSEISWTRLTSYLPGRTTLQIRER